MIKKPNPSTSTIPIHSALGRVVKKGWFTSSRWVLVFKLQNGKRAYVPEDRSALPAEIHLSLGGVDLQKRFGSWAEVRYGNWKGSNVISSIRWLEPHEFDHCETCLLLQSLVPSYTDVDAEFVQIANALKGLRNEGKIKEKPCSIQFALFWIKLDQVGTDTWGDGLSFRCKRCKDEWVFCKNGDRWRGWYSKVTFNHPKKIE